MTATGTDVRVVIANDDQLVPALTVPDPAVQPGGQLLDEPFPSWVGPTAFLGAVLFPFLTLGGSLLMLSSEQRPARRSLLKTTAIGSAVWLAVGVVVVVVFASSGAGSTGCRGGVTYLDPPTYTSMDNKNWVAEYPCALGGHSSSPLPPGQQPFGG